jgi:hypothetical protein
MSACRRVVSCSCDSEKASDSIKLACESMNSWMRSRRAVATPLPARKAMALAIQKTKPAAIRFEEAHDQERGFGNLRRQRE